MCIRGCHIYHNRELSEWKKKKDVVERYKISLMTMDMDMDFHGHGNTEMEM